MINTKRYDEDVGIRAAAAGKIEGHEKLDSLPTTDLSTEQACQQCNIWEGKKMCRCQDVLCNHRRYVSSLYKHWLCNNSTSREQFYISSYVVRKICIINYRRNGIYEDVLVSS